MMALGAVGIHCRISCIFVPFYLTAVNYHRYTRTGLELVIPQAITNLFVSTFLDSEIWYYLKYHSIIIIIVIRFGRGLYAESRKFIQSAAYPQNLQYMRYCF